MSQDFTPNHISELTSSMSQILQLDLEPCENNSKPRTIFINCEGKSRVQVREEAEEKMAEHWGVPMERFTRMLPVPVLEFKIKTSEEAGGGEALNFLILQKGLDANAIMEAFIFPDSWKSGRRMVKVIKPTFPAGEKEVDSTHDHASGNEEVAAVNDTKGKQRASSGTALPDGDMSEEERMLEGALALLSLGK
ncbi:hypothetical protein JR316_0012442 [Psilocybe cubensis]|uniref:Uncharacterized protein n=1 Tax=Psilocybe cubensis TaxID=181762 RepID=A0ACB8GJE0_PSICU|nr:hypothetical protein JR316_0012442 [Psilocybe cubensis]KAH9475331.1 hypothetical protein JR316_0012442 [Psilocybe cubensis]